MASDNGTTIIDQDDEPGIGGRIVGLAKQAGLYTVDSYDKSVQRHFGVQRKVVGITRSTTLSKLTDAQEKLVVGVGGAATNLVRGVLS